MPKPAVKVAISLPTDLHRRIESARKATRQSRSAVVQEALRQWLGRRAQADLVREYEDSYRARPESRQEADQALATAVDLLGDDEDDW